MPKLFTGLPGQLCIAAAFLLQGSNTAAQAVRHGCVQVLQEHKRAFDYNIAILKGFKVGYKRFLLAVQKLIPSWVYLAGIFAMVPAWIAYYMSARQRG